MRDAIPWCVLIKDVMTSNPVTVRATDSLERVAQLMWDQDSGSCWS